MAISKEKLNELKRNFYKGMRVKLVKMSDPYASIQVGELGTVNDVDDYGTIHVNWDCGDCLGVLYMDDKCEKIDEINIMFVDYYIMVMDCNVHMEKKNNDMIARIHKYYNKIMMCA